MEIEDTSQESAQVSEGAAKLGRRIGARAQRLGRSLLDLLLPPLCVGCGSRLFEHDTLCPACWRQIDFIRHPLCDRLGIPLPYDTGGIMVSAAAVADPPDYDRARAVARYDGLMRKLIHDLKFNDSQHGRRLFARWLCETGAELISAADVVIAIPLARPRLIQRRFNQSQLLAAEVAARSGKTLACTALVRTRATKSQVGLSRSERQRNVAGAFRVANGQVARVSGRSVLLIDDVVTTGATAGAAARALRKAGARRVDVLALCLAGDVPHTV